LAIDPGRGLCLHITTMKPRDLFEAQSKKEHRHEPLAERMRPRTLAEFVGQEEILGPGRFLGKAISSDRLPSILLWGPPGSGKTTLASVIAHTSGSLYVPFSALQGGVKEIREIAHGAAEQRDVYRQRTILFIDEIHRLNKGQQDALLPHVERGTLTLIGATTENPSFEVVSALLSRCRVFVLKPLEERHLREIVSRALTDPERGLGALGLTLDEEAFQELESAAQGDARRALNILEATSDFVLSSGGSVESRSLSAQAIREVAQRRTLLYDKSGDEHYNVVSAFIKSLRGSDPHAAVYWMTRMLEAGEDPRFILRRMIIFASEDIGNADPRALSLAVAALSAHEFVGLPESTLAQSQAVTYLATAPKSNSALTAYARARKDVRERGALPVPLHLRNAPTSLMRELGYGRDYRYPHDFQGHHLAETYLPDALAGHVYYTPSRNGHEKEIADRLGERREKARAEPDEEPS